MRLRVIRVEQLPVFAPGEELVLTVAATKAEAETLLRDVAAGHEVVVTAHHPPAPASVYPRVEDYRGLMYPECRACGKVMEDCGCDGYQGVK